MNRNEAIARLGTNELWDIVVIGGGATGLGIAVDAATRGYRTLLLERNDFAHGTSSRSTKLIHGGIRYLKQGNFALVRHSLLERSRLLKNAPDLVTGLGFVIPVYSWTEKYFYAAGLQLYDLLARGNQPFPTQVLTRAETLARLPTLKTDGLTGGILYADAQFDDARLALRLAQSATAAGATVLNYFPVTGLLKTGGKICGVLARDGETGATFEIRARAVINATGIFSDQIRRLDEPDASGKLSPSQGAHMVLPAGFLPGQDALMIPSTSDGRVLFAIPWQGRVLLGTTDTPVAHPADEPRVLPEEIGFLLAHIGKYLTRAPEKSDILSIFAGQRPLVRQKGPLTTAAISREHLISIADSGLLTIAGGKWTTYREMAEDAVDRIVPVARLPMRPCHTADMPLAAGPEIPDHAADETPLHPRLPVRATDIIRAARREMARTVEDVLSRRTRCLYLNARAASEVAPRVAQLLAAELTRDSTWINEQTNAFQSLAVQHLPQAD